MRTFGGCVNGFVFRTGDNGTGYYRDRTSVCEQRVAGQDEPTTILLDELIKHSACNKTFIEGTDTSSMQWPRSRRARRARQADGKRRKKPSRRQVANLLARQGKGNYSCCPETGSIKDRWWRELGMWAVETGNPNSWRSGCEKMLRASSADVVALQEARISNPERLEAASNEARRLGWNPVLAPALKA